MTPDTLPLVSILVPVYNGAPYLRECLDSVLSQTHANLQVVIVDDGSTDASAEIAEGYAAGDARVEVHCQPNGGVSAARNALLSHVRGEYFLFVDADDWIEPHTVHWLLSATLSQDADIATCCTSGNGLRGTTLEVWDRERSMREFLIHRRLNGSLCTKLVRTSLAKDLTFPSDIFYGEDALFTWALLHRVKNLAYTDAPLYHYRVNAGSASVQKWTPDRKGTGHTVWQQICAETAAHCPQYLPIARARFALEDMMALYYAATTGYPRDNEIMLRQKNVASNLHNIRRTHIAPLRQYLTACVLCRWYGFAPLLKKYLRLSF